MNAQARSTISERVALAVVLLVAAFVRFWDLDVNGFANPYYGAAHCRPARRSRGRARDGGDAD
jgi:hypothetical protein